MANQVKNYFLAPSTDYPPDTTALSLGNVVISPKRAVPALAHAPSAFPPHSLIKSSKSDFQWTRSHTSSVKLGVWAKFAQLLDAGASTDASHTRQEIYSFTQMETTEFFPDEEYIRTALNVPAVKQYLDRQGFRKSVYMVVGTKAVRGATVKTVRSSDKGAGLNAGVDLVAMGGSPVALGGEVGAQLKNEEEIAFRDDKDFIFAFRLRKVRIRGNGSVAQDDYNRNTLLGVDDDEPSKDEFSAVGLEDADAGAENFCIEQVIDEDDQVNVLFP